MGQQRSWNAVSYLALGWGNDGSGRSQDRWKQWGVSEGLCHCSPAISQVFRKLSEPYLCSLEADAASFSNLIMMQLTSLRVLSWSTVWTFFFLTTENPKQRFLSGYLWTSLTLEGHYKLQSHLRSSVRNAQVGEEGWLLFMELQGRRETAYAFLVAFLPAMFKSS